MQVSFYSKLYGKNVVCFIEHIFISGFRSLEDNLLVYLVHALFNVYAKIMASATIIVRHFPPQISSEEKEEFLKYFGAKYVKILTSKTNRRCIAYAR